MSGSGIKSLVHGSLEAQLLLCGEACVDCNEAALRLLGCARKEDLFGRRLQDCAPPLQPDGEPSPDRAEAMVAAVLAQGSCRFTWVCRNPDGGEVPVEITLTALAVDGEPLVHALLRRTEQAHPNRSPFEHELRFRNFAELLPQILFEMDVAGRITFVNNRGLARFGYSEEEFARGISMNQVIIPEDWTKVLDNMRRILSGEGPLSTEYTAVRKDGSRFPVIISSTVILEGERPVGLRGIVTDITGRKKAEEALRQSELRFRQLFDGADAGIIVRDAETYELLDANRKFCEMYGYTPAELKRLPLGSLSAGEPPEARQRRLLEHYREVTMGGGTKTYRLETARKDGSTFWAEMKVQRLNLGDRDYLLTVSRDITQLRSAEEALRKSEEAARLLARETALIAAIGRIISSSLDIEDVYGRFAEAMRGLLPFDRILINLVDQRKGMMTTAYTAGMEVPGREKGATLLIEGSVTEQMLRAGAPVLLHLESAEEVARRFPGLVHAFHAGLRSRLSVLLVCRGDVVGSLALWSKEAKAYGEHDIRLAQGVASQIAGAIASARLYRERTSAEEALRESEESYRSLVETSPDAVFLHEEGRLVYLNPAAVRLYGAGSAEELYGRDVFSLVHPDDREAIRERADFVEATGVPVPLREIRIVRCDGLPVHVEAAAGVSFYRGKKVVQVIQRDITERKRAEEQIRTSLREKDVLLQEIHHRVKNNLQIVSSLLYLQASRTEHPGAVSALRESRNRVKSMALIHERLYQSPNLASVDMKEYTRSLVRDLRNFYRSGQGSVRMTLTIDDIPLGITEAIPCGLIINELVSNALKHAFPEGRRGTVAIELRRGDAGGTTLSVSDDGIGFPEQLDFKSSPSLGLTLVNSLVAQLGGTIDLDRGSGTVFTVQFG